MSCCEDIENSETRRLKNDNVMNFMRRGDLIKLKKALILEKFLTSRVNINDQLLLLPQFEPFKYSPE